ncbi:MAG: hypothetical protein WA956_00570 [Stenotrophomonas sp.]
MPAIIGARGDKPKVRTQEKGMPATPDAPGLHRANRVVGKSRQTATMRSTWHAAIDADGS